jgi:hypothetical protein
MRRAALTAVVGGAVALLGACDISHNHVTGTVTGSGELVTESRSVGGFTGVSVSSAGRLIVEQTGVESLEVTAEVNILPYIRSEVVGDVLRLGLAPGTRVSRTQGVVYRLTVRDLTAIEASGASHVEAHGLQTPELACVFSGASSLDASGSAHAQVIVLSGASRAVVPGLRSRVVTATLSGASFAQLRASDSLVATASGGSTLEYYGNPVLVTHISGGSVIRPVGP